MRHRLRRIRYRLVVPLAPVTIRFHRDTLALVTRAADEMGMSVAQFVRGASAARALIVLHGTGADQADQAILDLLEHPSVEAHGRARPE